MPDFIQLFPFAPVVIGMQLAFWVLAVPSLVEGDQGASISVQLGGGNGCQVFFMLDRIRLNGGLCLANQGSGQCE